MATTPPPPPRSPGDDIANVAGQTRDLIDSFIIWLRTDSLEALIGIGIAVAIFTILGAVRHLGCRLLKKDHGWQLVANRILTKTKTIFLAALSADLVANFIAPPGPLNTAIDFIFTIAAVFQGAIWIRELVLGFVSIRASAGQPEEHYQLSSAMGMIRLLVNFVIWSLAFILVLDNLGVNVTALVAGLGVGGIAIGLAAQGIFADLFAALAILFDRPFRLGDTIRWDRTTGKVEAIGLKTTRVRANTGEQVVVSNRKLLDQDIFNLRRIDQRRVTLAIPIAPSTSSEKLALLPDLARGVVEAEKNARFTHANLLEMTANGLTLDIEFHMTVPAFEEMSATRHRVILGLKKAFEEREIVNADLTPPRGAELAPPEPEAPPAPR